MVFGGRSEIIGLVQLYECLQVLGHQIFVRDAVFGDTSRGHAGERLLARFVPSDERRDG